jgi:L-seryl-tRNA(Ser) seleniumtransferase
MAGLRALPSVDKLLRSEALRAWDDRLIHPIRVKLAQELVAELRAAIQRGEPCPPSGEIEARLAQRFQSLVGSGMRRVINATGVCLHTNLGRAPWGSQWLVEMNDCLSGYCSLEFDLKSGERGSRFGAAERMLTLLTGAEAAIAVNNCAAAIYLILHTLAKGGEVPISRGELVQIGGGFRVPDILAASGAHLVEVGTTNMTSAQDFEKAVGPATALILKVHQSNFTQQGHTAEAAPLALAALAKKIGKPFVVDLGSGSLADEGFGEPPVETVLGWGASLVCFSGDKLFGGPQAGIIVGSLALVQKLKASPLYRALRPGKAELFLLEKSLHDYLRGAPPLLVRLIRLPVEGIRWRAERLAAVWPPALGKAEIVEGFSSVGGGTNPTVQLPTVLLAWRPVDPEPVARKLLEGTPAVVVRRENGRLLLDLRTVLIEEQPQLLRRLIEVAACLS